MILVLRYLWGLFGFIKRRILIIYKYGVIFDWLFYKCMFLNMIKGLKRDFEEFRIVIIVFGNIYNLSFVNITLVVL